MSAYEDIRKALVEAPMRKPDHERVLLVGWPALQALKSAVKTGEAPEDAEDMILGVHVRTTQEFVGWEIRDVDRHGVWHAVPARVSA